MTSPAFADARADVVAQLKRLVPPDLLRNTPRAYLKDLGRYLDAAVYRLDNLQGKVAKDRSLTLQMEGLQHRVDAVRASEQLSEEECTQLDFQLQELRVGLFAQPLNQRGRQDGRERISEKKMERLLTDAERRAGLR